MAGITGRNPYGTYQNPYLPSMNGYQVPGYGWPGMQTGPQQAMVQQPGPVQAGPQMSLPTVHADILQVAEEEAMEKQPVDAGTSQMMITRDETVIGVKSVLANGESTLDIYRKQPKAAKPAEPEYVTRAEFEKRIAEMIRETAEPVRPVLRVVEPEPDEDDEQEYETPAPRPVQRTRNTTGGKRR